MREVENILISVEAAYAARMLDGTKTIELRRRPVRLKTGSKMWVYSKLPRGQVELVATISDVIEGHPSTIWRKYGKQTGVSRKDYFEYFSGAKTAHAITIDYTKKLLPILSLEKIREQISNFHPPQFFKRLEVNSPELNFFSSALR